MATYKTSDGKVITAGLRVFTTDWRWGTVTAEQFDNPADTAPGGKYFTGWFNVELDDNGGKRLYNGERMTTKRPRSVAHL